MQKKMKMSIIPLSKDKELLATKVEWAVVNVAKDIVEDYYCRSGANLGRLIRRLKTVCQPYVGKIVISEIKSS